jgi:NYN domain-containing protein/OST-HTH/LOTUS domain-containing protein
MRRNALRLLRPTQKLGLLCTRAIGADGTPKDSQPVAMLYAAPFAYRKTELGQPAETVAIYWDFENLHASLLDQANGVGAYAASRFRPQDEIIDISTIIEYALSVGSIAINRAFANWVSFNRYRTSLLQSAIELIQVFPPGANAKNGADIKLCLDVIDDMVRFPHVGTIIVIGGDSDYMPLSYKVKAAGRTLIGIGSRGSTNQHWARSCHEFKFYESLLNPSPPLITAENPAPVMPTQSEPISVTNVFCTQEETEEIRELLVIAADSETGPKTVRELVSKAIARLMQTRGEAWIQKARLRPYIQRMDPTFHESNFGFANFNEMLASMKDLVESRKGKFDHELRLRSGGSTADTVEVSSS